jgi:hypothetical protein
MHSLGLVRVLLTQLEALVVHADAYLARVLQQDE